MFKDTFECTDFLGNPYTETCYFNLTESEIKQALANKNSGFYKAMVSATRYKDGLLNSEANPDIPAINAEYVAFINNIDGFIESSYGILEDATHFVKSPEIFARFKSSPAYDVLYNKLSTDSEYTQKFIMNLIPAAIKNDPKFQEEYNKTMQDLSKVAEGNTNVEILTDVKAENQA